MSDADPAEMRRRQQRQKDLRKRLDLVTTEVEKAEGCVNAINEMFCAPPSSTATQGIT
jgi:hypothetical protein